MSLAMNTILVRRTTAVQLTVPSELELMLGDTQDCSVQA